MRDEADVVVVGGGIAGLLCARELQRAGLDVLVLEAGDAPGGRVRTDVVDGFRCDRGFQLLNPAYPAARRHLDLDALDLRVFGRGVEVRTTDGLATVADPLRRPGTLPETLRSGYLRPAELARTAGWVAPALGPVSRLLAGRDRTLTASLDAAHVDGRLRREVLEPFLTGVLADDRGDSSATFVRLLLRSFLRATPGVPALGMQALPDQLAVLPGRQVRLGTRVVEVRADDREVVADGLTASGRAVVVATDPATASDLLGLSRPTLRGLRTWWFTAPEAPTTSTLLRLDGRGRAAGPVVNTVVMTNVAPTYAPRGRPLVQATTLLPSDAGESDVRRHLAELYAAPTDDWELVVRHDVPEALPLVTPPLEVRRPVDLGDGLFVAGDHRDTSSLQGALVSGARTAAAVRRHLATS
ncbi:NAD(P)/FAD-dependent oxidoreductase [Nocardioides sp. MAHUQ-72]|uniref:NAD(P)/FAD-dependent oxidoreductase n=1 Tax=unclassified Nocardioides TaxID=2615069 RepID=UPI0036115A01